MGYAKVRWIPTSREVYAQIYSKHRADLTVFSSFTNPEESNFGPPKIMTAWGFKDADAALIKHEATGEKLDQHAFFIASVKVENDD